MASPIRFAELQTGRIVGHSYLFLNSVDGDFERHIISGRVQSDTISSISTIHNSNLHQISRYGKGAAFMFLLDGKWKLCFPRFALSTSKASILVWKGKKADDGVPSFLHLSKEELQESISSHFSYLSLDMELLSSNCYFVNLFFLSSFFSVKPQNVLQY